MSTFVPKLEVMAFDEFVLLTNELVLQCRGERWRRMGNLQRPVRVGEFGHLWLCPLVQLLLDCSHNRLPRNAIQ